MFNVAPSEDLTLDRFPADRRARAAMLVRWIERMLLDLAPKALQIVDHRSEADELLARLPRPVSLGEAGAILALCRELEMGIWPVGPVPLNRELAFEVLRQAHEAAKQLALESGHLQSEWTTWDEDSGPGEPIPRTAEDVAREEAWRMVCVGSAARTIAHVGGGERGYRAEVAWQYREIERQAGIGPPYEGKRWGPLEAGRRYRFYEPYTDLDGHEHRWGESWSYEGFVFDPWECALTLHVRDGVQLDKGARPLHAIEVRPFRVAVAVGDKPGYPREPLSWLLAPE